MNPLLARFAGQKAFLNPNQENRFTACLDAVMAHPRAQEFMSETVAYNDDGFWPDPESWKASYRPYVVRDGILQIPVKGVLLHDFPWTIGSYATGYDYIWRCFQRGCADYAIGMIKGIALVIDSCGGMVAGCFDANDKMYALMQQTKVPVRAFAQEDAFSAAYAVATVAPKIIVSRTGGVGSIGVVTMHVDYSGMLEQDGVKVTFIFAGKHKVDGNQYEALPADVKDRIQAEIDELYEVFVSTVARNRPQMSEEEIRATEALCFTATKAVSNKLADSIGSLDDSLAAYAVDLSTTDGEDDAMTTKTEETATAVDAAVAAANSANATATATAVAEAKTAERARVASITGSDEAKGRETLANHIAMNTDMTVDDAKKMLAAAPLAAAAPAATEASPFETAMDVNNPEVGAAAAGAEGAHKDDKSADVLKLVHGAALPAFAKPASK